MNKNSGKQKQEKTNNNNPKKKQIPYITPPPGRRLHHNSKQMRNEEKGWGLWKWSKNGRQKQKGWLVEPTQARAIAKQIQFDFYFFCLARLQPDLSLVLFDTKVWKKKKKKKNSARIKPEVPSQTRPSLCCYLGTICQFALFWKAIQSISPI